MRWNKLQEDVSARKSLLDAWRQVRFKDSFKVDLVKDSFAIEKALHVIK